MNINDVKLISRLLDDAVNKLKQAEAYMDRQYQDQSVEITLRIMELEKTIRKAYR
ncbi:hypothetical protein EVB68_103 [Rhizobium phage RHph_Y2_6]|uniref:Uncharacterized protein n=1 Tax=Rhizobium phage RHph_Y2_6 TaxID=2509576 RepID=A0A7S5UT36_9CAUD|nr:hypothetical protein PP748_gp093 [Rhizobium phage RHph_Y2_6]QIG68838.1 hypothetical protein EVB68_103 [Rhizobium phage RHph_Y2_6]